MLVQSVAEQARLVQACAGTLAGHLPGMPLALSAQGGRAGPQIAHPPAAGVRGLRLLKTTQSGYAGFLHDRFTLLPDTRERIMASAVTATWRCARARPRPLAWRGRAWPGQLPARA